MSRALHLILTLLVVNLSYGQGTSQRIAFQWLNQPCGEIINCNAGCSACNLPANSSPHFIGTNMAWFGVDPCPLPLTPGDNAVFSVGWTTMPTSDHFALFSGIVLQPMHIDSIMVRHSTFPNGPERLKVSFTANAAAAMVEIADVEIPDEFGSMVLTDVGDVLIPAGSPMGTFQLRFNPYQGTGGAWAVDEILVVASPATNLSTGVQELWNRSAAKGPWYDVLGKPMGAEPAPGLYVGPGGKRVYVL